MKHTLRSKNGSASVSAALVVLVFALVISVFLFIAYVQIQTVVVRNAMKTSLANLAVTISEDTFTALRESDFEAYAARLTGSSAYRRQLEATYHADVAHAAPLETDRYRITAIRLDFYREGKKLRYVCTCDVSFTVTALGLNLPAIARSVQVEGCHTAKYGR